MLPSRQLRWAGAGISNGRQRLVLRGSQSRNFSINNSSPSLPRSTLPRFSSRPTFAQQSRSLSLFGWGGSSKPPSESSSSPSSTSEIEIGPNSTGLDNVRTIKASHATSDIPAPTQAAHHSPNNLEPQIIEDLQESLTFPHGAASEKVAEIVSGETDVTGAAERMGYLKEVCGLDFGWGTSSIMEYFLEWLHVSGGLSWTTSIIVVAAVLRLAMVKPIIDSQIQGKKMREMQPYTKPLREKYTQLMAAGDRAKAMEIGAQMKEINKSANISYTRAFVPLLIQLPFSFGAFRVLRNAGQLPVPAFVTEDWLWTTDLSFSDPYYITPAISAAAIYFSFKLQQKQQGPNAMFPPGMMTAMGTLMPILSFAFMSFQPGSVQLYFMTTGVFAFGTTALLRQQWFRNVVALGPLPTTEIQPSGTTPAVASAPSQPAPKKLPANIQRIAPVYKAPIKPVESEAQPASDRSVIDRAVDGVKGKWQNLSANTKGQSIFGTSVEKREKEQRKASDDRYHATRQRELERRRDERNKQARGT